jgi:hypothetical protein
MAFVTSSAKRISVVVTGIVLIITALAACGPSKPKHIVLIKVTVQNNDNPQNIARRCEGANSWIDGHQSDFLKSRHELTSSGEDKFLHIGKEYIVQADGAKVLMNLVKCKLA